MSAQNLIELLELTKRAIILIFCANRVDFFLMDREFIKSFKNENGISQSKYHAHFRFEVALLDEQGLKDKCLIPFHFKHLSEVYKGLTCNGKHCIWPVYKNDSKSSILLIQITHNPANELEFVGKRDTQIIEEIAQAMS